MYNQALDLVNEALNQYLKDPQIFFEEIMMEF